MRARWSCARSARVGAAVFAAAAAAVLTLVATPAGATVGDGSAPTVVAPAAVAPAATTAPPIILLQAFTCPTFADVPRNRTVAVLLDDTGGGYRGWGPALQPDDQALSAVAGPPPGCRPLSGARLWLSSTLNGAALARAPGAAGPDPRADGQRTTLVAEPSDATGRLVVGPSALTPAQRAAVSGTGLWVAAVGYPGRFANLQCHNDRYNADDLEVLRVYVPTPQVVCALYVVGAASQAPSPDDTKRGSSGPAEPPSTVPAPPSTVPSQATTTATPGNGGAGAGRAETPTPPPAVIPAPNPAPPAATSNPAPAGSPTSPGPAGDTGGELALPAAVPTAAAAPITRFSVRLEVGGVTRGAEPGRLVGAESTWRAPLRVSYRCGNDSATIEVSPPQSPGHVAPGPVLTVPNEGASCTVTALSGGTVGPPPTFRLGQRDLTLGEIASIAVPSGATMVATVSVNYDGAPLLRSSAVEANGQATSVDAAPPTSLAPSTPTSRLTPAISVGLGAVFVIGLLLSVLAARREL